MGEVVSFFRSFGNLRTILCLVVPFFAFYVTIQYNVIFPVYDDFISPFLKVSIALISFFNFLILSFLTRLKQDFSLPLKKTGVFFFVIGLACWINLYQTDELGSIYIENRTQLILGISSFFSLLPERVWSRIWKLCPYYLLLVVLMFFLAAFLPEHFGWLGARFILFSVGCVGLLSLVVYFYFKDKEHGREAYRVTKNAYLLLALYGMITYLSVYAPSLRILSSYYLVTACGFTAYFVLYETLYKKNGEIFERISSCDSISRIFGFLTFLVGATVLILWFSNLEINIANHEFCFHHTAVSTASAILFLGLGLLFAGKEFSPFSVVSYSLVWFILGALLIGSTIGNPMEMTEQFHELLEGEAKGDIVGIPIITFISLIMLSVVSVMRRYKTGVIISLLMIALCFNSILSFLFLSNYIVGIVELFRLSFFGTIGLLLYSIGWIVYSSGKLNKIDALHLWVLIPSYIGFLALGTTLILWFTTKQVEEDLLVKYYRSMINKGEDYLGAQFKGYRQVLQGAEGLITGSDKVTLDEWDRVYTITHKDDWFKGICCIGFIIPDKEQKLDITLISPNKSPYTEWLNKDLSSIPHLKEFLLKSKKSGEPAVLDSEKMKHFADGQMLLVFPVWRDQGFLGWTFLLINVNQLHDLFQQVTKGTTHVKAYLGQEEVKQQHLFSIGKEREEASFYREKTKGTLFKQPVLFDWRINDRDGYSFFIRPNFLLLGGAVFSLGLYLLFHFLALSYRRESSLNDLIAKRLDEAEEEVHVQRDEIQALIDHIPTMIIHIDDEQKIKKVNKAAAQSKGFFPEELKGKEVREIFPLITQNHFGRVMPQIQQGKEVFGTIGQYLSIDGTKWVKIDWIPIKKLKGISYELIIVMSDITKEIEFGKALEIERDRAEKANVAKSHFLSTMSHELRTPLHQILGTSELLESKVEEEKDRVKCMQIQDSANSLLRMVESILDFTESEGDELALNLKELELGVFVERLVEGLMGQAKKSQVTLQSFIPEKVPKVLGDEVLLTKILRHLIDNAIRFNPKKHVLVELHIDEISKKTATLSFSVKDTGEGIPKHMMENLFTPFTQADQTSKRRFSGPGLGLSIVKQFAKQMGGTLKVDSKEGSGTLVTVTITFETSPG